MGSIVSKSREQLLLPSMPRWRIMLRSLGDISGFNIVATMRNPIDRAISYYFSPHRWKRQRADGSWFSVPTEWSFDQFVEMLPEIKRAADFLKVGGRIANRIDFLRFDHLSADFAALVVKLKLPISGSLEHRNKSADAGDLIAAAISDPNVKKVVHQYFAEDFEVFSSGVV